MVDVEAKDGSVLLTFKGRRGPTSNSLTLTEAEQLIEDLEAAIAAAESE